MSNTLKKPPVLQPGEGVLVTGANGYVASHIIDLLLSLGYHVRGTVRAEKPWLDEYFTTKYGTGMFESVVIPDLAQKESLINVLGGISGVLHVATDMSHSADAESVINNVLRMTQSVLEAAAEVKSVKRVILTSSVTAVPLAKPGVEGVIIDENSWNDKAVQLAWDGSDSSDPSNFVTVYSASKTEGERFAFTWVKEHNPRFVFNSILPNFVLGPLLSPDFNGSSGKVVLDLLHGNSWVIPIIPPEFYINAQDVARIHAIGLLDPDIASQRLFAFAGTFNWTEIISILHKLRPDNNRLPTPPENEGRNLSIIKPAKRAEDLLKSWFDRPGWISLEETLKDALISVDLQS